MSSYEIKASVLTVDDASFDDIRDIYDDILIGHSPLALLLLARTLGHLGKPGVDRIRELIAKNRSALWAQAPSCFEMLGRSYCSVEWVGLRDEVSGAAAVNTLSQAGVKVLPGDPFYWHRATAQKPERVRIALLRESDYFIAGAQQLSAILSDVGALGR